MSGFLITPNGPLHWSSKRQNNTARNSVEAEIYATNECIKELIYLHLLLLELSVLEVFIPNSDPFTVYDYIIDCVYWYKSTTTKGFIQISICGNAIR